MQRERGLTNDALARRAAISGRLLSKYRAGESEPRTPFGEPSENAYRLAGALGCVVEDLLDPTLEVAA